MGKRLYKFTNFKAFLITTVVFGHFVQCMPDCGIRSFLMLYIYSFHMPAFVFISGFFSKNVEKGSKNAFENYFIPFFYMSIVYILINLIITKTIYVRFIVPVFAAWYVLVIFYYKLIIKYIYRFPPVLVMSGSILVSLAVGLIPWIGSEFCLERTFSFLPFFLAGYYLKNEQIEYVKMKLPKFVAPTVLIIAGVVFLLYVRNFPFNYQPMLCNVSYVTLGFSWWQGILYKLYFTGMALLLTFLLLLLFREKQYKFSYIGDHTMSVYGLHCIAFLIVRKTGLMCMISPVIGIVVAAILTLVVVYLLSLPKVYSWYMAGIHFCSKFEKKYILAVYE